MHTIGIIKQILKYMEVLIIIYVGIICIDSIAICRDSQSFQIDLLFALYTVSDVVDNEESSSASLFLSDINKR